MVRFVRWEIRRRRPPEGGTDGAARGTTAKAGTGRAGGGASGGKGGGRAGSGKGGGRKGRASGGKSGGATRGRTGAGGRSPGSSVARRRDGRQDAAKGLGKGAAKGARKGASEARKDTKGARKGASEARKDARDGQKGGPAGGSGAGAEGAAAQRPLLQRGSLGAQLARIAVLLVAFACAVGFAVALARVTLVPEPGSASLVHTNLRPGASLRAYLDQPGFRDTVKQVGGNVVLGAPFGVLLPMLVPAFRGAFRVLGVTAVVMVLVELVQGAIVVGRAFDIDDVILNTTGAVLGYLVVGRRLGRALHPRRHHWWQRSGSGRR